jgi:hypothetical protein
MPVPVPTILPAGIGDVVINELQYDPVQGGVDAAFEWLELYNRTSRTIYLTNWKIEDNGSDDYIPALQLPPGGFIVLAAGTGFYANFPDFSGDLMFIVDGRIGNGLNNDGDRLSLFDSNGVFIDAMSYGENTAVMSPSCQDVAEGHSLERQPAGWDTDQASDFVDNGLPSPGTGMDTPAPTPKKSPVPSPSPMSTAVPSITPSPTPTVTIIPLSTKESYNGAMPASTLTPEPTTYITAVPESSPFATATPNVTSQVTQNPTPMYMAKASSDGSNSNVAWYLGISSFLALIGVGSLLLVLKVRRKG